MKKYGIVILLILLGILIGYLILGDFLKSNLKKSSGNPYAYQVDDFKKIDPALVKYTETSRIKLLNTEPIGIDYQQGKLGIVYQHAVQLIDTAGIEIFNRPMEEDITCLSFSPEGILFVGSRKMIYQVDQHGNVSQSWVTAGENSLITAFAFKDNLVFAADAGLRVVHRYDRGGELIDSFDGTGRLEGNYGFILPSPYFDMAIDPEGALWVANTGLLKIENYSDEGTLRAFWGKPSFDLDGFTGCCNPVHFVILPDGSFVTCEKGLIRIKVHKPSGEFDSVVAGPETFEEDSKPPDLAADENGKIYVLDITRNRVRIFKRNNT
jgi:hypothetical protein